MMEYDDRCFREENEFDLYWGIEEPYWKYRGPGCLPRFHEWIKQLCIQQQVINNETDPSTKLPAKAAISIWIDRAFVALPLITANIVWLCCMLLLEKMNMFIEESGYYNNPRFLMTVAMLFISFLTGATGSAGAALLFPILTLLLGHGIDTTRQAYFLLQATCMIYTTYSNVYMGVAMEQRALVYGSAGGVAGVLAGISTLSSRPDAEYLKMYCACIWMAVGVVTFGCNFYHTGRMFHAIGAWENGNLLSTAADGPAYSALSLCKVLNWRVGLLIVLGFLGGLLSALVGPGVEIAMFAALVLYFQVSERVATPTITAIMAITYSLAVLGEVGSTEGIQLEAWKLWGVSIPVITVFSPLGAILGSTLHRNVILSAFYLGCSLQFIITLAAILPWTTANTPGPTDLCIKSAAIGVAAAVFFTILYASGQHLLGLNGIEGQFDESFAGKGKPVKVNPPAGSGEEEDEGKSGEDSESVMSLASIYPHKEQITPLEKEHRLVMLQFSPATSYEVENVLSQEIHPL